MEINLDNIKKMIPCILTSVFMLIIPCIWADDAMLDASLLPRQLALSVFLLAAIPILALFVVKGERFSFNRIETVIFGCMLLFMLTHIVSCVNAINGHEAFFHLSKEFLFCYWFFFIYQMLKDNQQMRDILIKTITIVSAIFIGIAYVQLMNSDFSEYRAATNHRSYYLSRIMEDVYSTCSNKNLLASLLFFTLPLSIYHIVNVKRHCIASVVWFGLSLMIAIANLTLIVILLSRTAIGALTISVGVACILLYVYILYIKPHKTGQASSKRSKAIMIAAPMILLATIVAFIYSTDTQIEKAFTERLALTINPEKYGYKDNQHGESSLAMRKIIWGKTVNMIKEHPLIGSGPGQWQILIPKYGVDEFNEQLREGSLTFQRPHNDYLWIASEVGVFGLLAFVIFQIVVIFVGIRNIKQASDTKSLSFNILAVSALIGWIFVMMLDYAHERVEHNLIVLAISAIVLAENTRSEKPGKQIGLAASAAIITCCAAIAIIGFVQSMQFYNGEKSSRKIMENYYDQDWQKLILMTRKSDSQPYTINNYSAPILFYRGVALSVTNNDKAAITAFSKALEFAPYHILTQSALGTSYIRAGLNDEAIKSCELTLKMSPKNHAALFNIAIAYYNKKDFKQAYNYISQLPIDHAGQPDNFKSAFLNITKLAVYEDRGRYNVANLSAWLNNDNKVLATIKKTQAENCSLEETLIKELGAR